MSFKLKFLGKEKTENINSNGLIENGNIPVYDFYLKHENEEKTTHIAISKKGGHVVLMNANRNVEAEIISQEEANEKGKKYLEEHGFLNMKETYFLKQSGIVTINYAYVQDNIVMYPDLIKLKIALDNGEIIGMEMVGYLNSHYERNISNIKISKEEAKRTLNKDLNNLSEQLAVIHTEWQTEILCYEFKGKINDTDFLVYINAENGIEEDILIIENTPNGTLTM